MLHGLSGSFLMFPESFLRNTRQYIRLSYFSFQVARLCNCTLLAANVKALEKFLETILCKAFQLFLCVLNVVSSITKAPSLQCSFQWREQIKINWIQVRWIWGMLQCCHALILDQEQPVCIVVKEKPMVLHFTGRFLHIASLRRRRMLRVYFFIHSRNSCKL